MLYQTTKAALLAGSMTLVAMPAFAQDNATADQVVADSEAGAGEIIVTARRKVESLQDVPQTVNAVKAEDFANYNILSIGDISKVVSGLQINGDNISMRGITFVTISNAPIPTVATYINDVPIPAIDFNVASFDIGQVEVLRGPQGTVRGIASPSGALTATTRRADLSELGAYVSGSVGTRSNFNVQGAIGVPIIKDVLAVRVAGVINETDGNGVRSVFSLGKPSARTKGIRASLRFEPTSNFDINFMYQRVQRDSQSFGAPVFGSGAPGGVNPNAPAGYNGPVLTTADYKAVTERPSDEHATAEIFQGNVGFTFAGQHLAYIGSYQKSTLLTTFTPDDSGNAFVGVEVLGPLQDSPRRLWTHEIRLSSDERIAGVFDYVLGYFHSSDNSPVIAGGAPFLALGGAYTFAGGWPTPTVNTRYLLSTYVDLPRRINERSFFGNLTAHIGDKLEISGGLRRISSDNLRDLTYIIPAALNGAALPQANCGPAGGQFNTGTGLCEFTIPASSTVIAKDNVVKDTAWIYDASISYRITPDLMVYGHFGTSWRPGGFGVGIFNGTNDPVINELIFQKPESSKSYEVGLKWSFLNRRARINLTYYHQTFKDFLYTVPESIPYVSYASASSTPTIGRVPNFTVNVPAKIDGIDLDVAFQITDRWSLSGTFSWQNGKVNGLIPCNDGDFNGTPDRTAPTLLGFQNYGQLIARCQLTAGSSPQPNWNLRAQTEYRMPLSDSTEAFARGLLAYQPRNTNASQSYAVPGYALVDLFVGVRSPDGQWEVTAYGKNIANTRTMISRGTSQIVGPLDAQALFGSTGYTTYSLAPRREFGLSLRKSFGSDAPR